MKTTKHGLSEKEMELVELLMADCICPPAVNSSAHISGQADKLKASLHKGLRAKFWLGAVGAALAACIISLS